MKNTIKRLYNGQIRDNEKDASKLYQTQEFKELGERLDELQSSFSDEQIRLFREYELAYGAFCAIMDDEIYANGFRTGFWLAIDLAIENE